MSWALELIGLRAALPMWCLMKNSRPTRSQCEELRARVAVTATCHSHGVPMLICLRCIVDRNDWKNLTADDMTCGKSNMACTVT